MRNEDELFLRPPSSSHDSPSSQNGKPRRKVILFFITGNPGLIGYYRAFLTRLHSLICNRQSTIDYFVYGSSLLGFENRDVAWCNLSGPKPPFSLRQQIDGVVTRLITATKSLSEGDQGDGEPVQVVLMGHSVGAYMLLEVVARWQDLALHVDHGRQLDIVGGICLFPTVVDLAKSPTGRMATPLFRIPYFALLLHALAKVLTTFMPMFSLVRLVQLITGMPDEGAQTTAIFIKSKYGVWQALHMAKDELHEMTHDKWSDELWGLQKVPAAATAAVNDDTHKSASATGTAITPKLYFYWGRGDHWIADSTRDAVIASRAMQQGGSLSEHSKPSMEIATDDVPHAFCLRHNESVAMKCAEYIKDLESRLQW